MLTLTEHELKILRLVAHGDSNKMIGDRLGIVKQTVSNEVSTILHKLGGVNRANAVFIGKEKGII